MSDALTARHPAPATLRAALPAVLAIYALRALLALALGWPLARMIADPTIAFARGDRVLFDDGALYLAELVRLYEPTLTAFAEGSVAVWLLVAYGGLLPLAVLLRALAGRGERGARSALQGAVGAFAPLSLLLGAAIVVSSLLWLFPVAAFGLIERKLSELLGDVGVDVAHAGARAVGFAAVIVVGIVHDLARAAVVRDDLGAFSAASAAVTAIRRHGVRACFGWGLRALAGAGLVAGAALAAAHLGVESNVRFAAVLAVHQAVALALVLLRAHWLAHALLLLPARPTEPDPWSAPALDA